MPSKQTEYIEADIIEAEYIEADIIEADIIEVESTETETTLVNQFMLPVELDPAQQLTASGEHTLPVPIEVLIGSIERPTKKANFFQIDLPLNAQLADKQGNRVTPLEWMQLYGRPQRNSDYVAGSKSSGKYKYNVMNDHHCPVCNTAHGNEKGAGRVGLMSDGALYVACQHESCKRPTDKKDKKDNLIKLETRFVFAGTSPKRAFPTTNVEGMKDLGSGLYTNGKDLYKHKTPKVNTDYIRESIENLPIGEKSEEGTPLSEFVDCDYLEREVLPFLYKTSTDEKVLFSIDPIISAPGLNKINGLTNTKLAKQVIELTSCIHQVQPTTEERLTYGSGERELVRSALATYFEVNAKPIDKITIICNLTVTKEHWNFYEGILVVHAPKFPIIPPAGPRNEAERLEFKRHNETYMELRMPHLYEWLDFIILENFGIRHRAINLRSYITYLQLATGWGKDVLLKALANLNFNKNISGEKTSGLEANKGGGAVPTELYRAYNIVINELADVNGDLLGVVKKDTINMRAIYGLDTDVDIHSYTMASAVAYGPFDPYYSREEITDRIYYLQVKDQHKKFQLLTLPVWYSTDVGIRALEHYMYSHITERIEFFRGLDMDDLVDYAQNKLKKHERIDRNNLSQGYNLISTQMALTIMAIGIKDIQDNYSLTRKTIATKGLEQVDLDEFPLPEGIKPDNVKTELFPISHVAEELHDSDVRSGKFDLEAGIYVGRWGTVGVKSKKIFETLYRTMGVPFSTERAVYNAQMNKAMEYFRPDLKLPKPKKLGQAEKAQQYNIVCSFSPDLNLVFKNKDELEINEHLEDLTREQLFTFVDKRFTTASDNGISVNIKLLTTVAIYHHDLILGISGGANNTSLEEDDEDYSDLKIIKEGGKS